MTQMLVPDYLKNDLLPDFTDRLAGNLGTGSPPYMSIEGGRFTLYDAAGDSEPVTTVDPKTGIPYIDCCIIDAGDHPSMIYRKQGYDPNNRLPPDCWSDNGVAPSISCLHPQANTCMPDPTGEHGCKLSVWGSKTSAKTGKGIPACGKYQKLALLLPGDDIQFLLRVPPNSLDNLRNYLGKFKGQPIKLRDCLTRISFEPQGIGTLTFIGVGLIDQPTAIMRNEVLLAKKTDMLVGRGDVPRSGGQPALPSPVASAQTSLPAPIASSPASPPVEVVAPSPLSSGAVPNAVAMPATQQPAETAAPARRRGRPPKADAPGPTGDPVAPFRALPAAETATIAQGGNGQFGMATAPAPNAELEAALKSMFG